MKPESFNEEMYGSEPAVKDYWLFNPSDREVTEEQNDTLLAMQVATAFVRIQEERFKAKIALGDAVLRGGAADIYRCKECAAIFEAQWERIQSELVPFVRDGTLAKTEFAHLEDEIELIDWTPSESTPKEVEPSFEVGFRRLTQARKLAERLRNELWKHVRKEGDPEKPTKLLPWEKS